MFQLLIVDDEPSVVDAIAHTVSWSEWNIDEVYCAYSAKEALKIAERHFIDIVLTDIRMPGMDGITLIETIRRQSQRTQFILLTGYAEFEYAQQALKLQAADYLLKPVSDEKLTEAIGNVTRRLKAEWEQIASYQRTMQVFRDHLPVLKSDILKNLLEGRPWDGELSDRLHVLDIPVRPGDIVYPLLIRLEDQFAGFDNRDRFLMEYAILNVAEEVVGGQFALWTCKDIHDYLVLVLKAKTGEENGADQGELVSRLANQLQHLVLHYLGGNISIVVGQSGRFPDDLVARYAMTVKTMRRRIGKDVGLLMEAGEPAPPSDMRPLSSLHEPPSLAHLFEAGMWEAARKKLIDTFDELEEKWNESPELLAELYHTVSAACFHYAHSNGKTLQQLLGEDGSDGAFSSLERLMSLPSMRKWAIGICDRFSQENLREIQDARARLIGQIQEYIHMHLADDVSLQTLADQANLHPVYLSKVFKLETGESLKEYLFRVRMERAVHLLLHSDLKIYEITAQVGYLNTAYFIKVFKKQFGKTPQEYRDEYKR